MVRTRASAAFDSAALPPALSSTVAISPTSAAAASQRSVRHRLDEVFVSNVTVYSALIKVEEVGGTIGQVQTRAWPGGCNETRMLGLD